MPSKSKIDTFRYLEQAHPPRPGITEANARLRFMVAQALAQNRVEFHLQPVVSAANPGRPAFFELLARIRLPGGRILPAAQFIPHIRNSELGCALDRLAFGRALEMLSATPGLRLSLNVTTHSMGDVEWHALLDEAAKAPDCVLGRLILEISERIAVEDSAQITEFMDYVRELGPAFALDDFGAGATGFGHFSRFRFDMVKIAPTYVRDVHASPNSQVLVECLLRLSRHFDMFSVATGVETEEEAEWLCNAGVDCMQGHHFGRPAPQAAAPGADDGTKDGDRAAG